MACHAQGRVLAGQIQSVLLSTDYVPDAIVSRLQRVWGCRVFRHYGMTEMGLGGAVDCSARYGYHLREADLLVEIIDPASGQPVPDGTAGEIVFTTLTRDGMLMIRYRTGARAVFKLDPCPCGTVLKTLGPIRGRMDNQVQMDCRKRLPIGDLDEAIFGFEGFINYHVDIDTAQGVDVLILYLDVLNAVRFEELAGRIHSAVSTLPTIRAAVGAGRLAVVIRPLHCRMAVSTGTGKRRIRDRRERNMHP